MWKTKFNVEINSGHKYINSNLYGADDQMIQTEKGIEALFDDEVFRANTYKLPVK